MQNKLNQIEQNINNPQLWNNQEAAIDLMKQKAELQIYLNGYDHIMKKKADIDYMLELQDPFFQHELDLEMNNLLEISKEIYIMCAFSKPCDKNNAYIQIQAGAGGTESEDWAAMLLRMYVKFCEKEGYKTEIIDLCSGEQPGLINSATVFVQADKALFPYGWLKHEHGIHRLVRISPFDANQRRHTSFSSVWISPELNTDIQIDLKETDLEIRECRASGAGGQHVNKTNSAIQILHKPTGIITQSQQERSQHQNKEIALKLLKSKLYMFEMNKLEQENQKHIMNKTDVSWGHQIRSYVLHPDKRIKDTRTGYESFNTQKILDGDIKEFLLEAVEYDISKQI